MSGEESLRKRANESASSLVTSQLHSLAQGKERARPELPGSPGGGDGGGGDGGGGDGGGGDGGSLAAVVAKICSRHRLDDQLTSAFCNCKFAHLASASPQLAIRRISLVFSRIQAVFLAVFGVAWPGPMPSEHFLPASRLFFCVCAPVIMRSSPPGGRMHCTNHTPIRAASLD